MESSTPITLALIKKALAKHNKDMNNDIKVSFGPDGLKFSSAKAEQIILETKAEADKRILKATLKQPLPMPVKAKKQSKPSGTMPGQMKLESMLKK